MFIAHGAWLRKYARWILAGVLILLIPGFIALYTQSGSSRREDSRLPTIRGKPVNAVEYQRARNLLTAEHVLSTGKLPTRTATLEDQLNQEAVVRIVLLKKAAELGVRVADDELVRQIRGQPMFLNDNKQFDPERYRRTMIFLNNYGIDESQFEEVMRQEFLLARLRMLVSSGAKVSPTELNLRYGPLYEKMSIDLVQLNDADHKPSGPVTDDEAKAFFEQNQESFRRPAQMKVRYVCFTIADAKKSVTVTDRDIADYYEHNQAQYVDTNNVPQPLDAVKIEIHEELLLSRAAREAADRATAMTTNLVVEAGTPRPDFVKVAAAFGVTPHETGYFALRDSVPGVEAGPQFNQEAFVLDPKDRPFSDPVTGKDGYYVLEYLDSKPSEIPTFEQVKNKITETIKQRRAHEATVKRGQDAVAEIKKAMAAGKTFSQACAELKLKSTAPEPFSLSDKEELPADAAIKQTVIGMATNSVSDFLPTATGGVFFHLKQRLPPDPAQFEKDKPQLAQQALEHNRQALFQDWVNHVLSEEQVNFGPRRSLPQPAGEEAEPPPSG